MQMFKQSQMGGKELTSHHLSSSGDCVHVLVLKETRPAQNGPNSPETFEDASNSQLATRVSVDGNLATGPSESPFGVYAHQLGNI